MKVYIIVFALLITGGVTNCKVRPDNAHLSDFELLQNFQAHEKDFEKLASMATEDVKVVRIAHDFTWLDDNLSWPRPESQIGFSKQRWDRYRSLFNKVGLKAGINRTENDPHTIFFMASTKGLAPGGSEKGYAYTSKEPVNLVESLDRTYNIQNNTPIFRKIKSDWYLYYKQVGR